MKKIILISLALAATTLLACDKKGSATVSVRGVTITPTDELSIETGGTIALAAFITPTDASDKNVTWESLNTGIATVNAAGLVTGVNAGPATIRATAADGSGKYGDKNVTVTVPVAGIAIAPEGDVSVEVNMTTTLTATATPAEANQSVTWSSSSPTVATVGEATGVVTGVKAGTATITATSAGGSGKYAEKSVTVTPRTDPDADKEYALVWADEFDYEGLPDPACWSMEIWNPGQVNNELQYYTNSPKNVDVRDGTLKINCIKEDNGRITSARVISAGKKTFTYGRFEIRARLPKGKGTWPAIWMLGQNIMSGTSWPTCGEIDIMEHVGYDQNVIVASAHTRDRNHTINTQASGRTTIAGVSDDFHVYTLEWTRTQMSWAVDGNVFYTYIPRAYDIGNWPFDDPEFLLLNVAWGGNWGAAQGIDESVLPQTMEIDYVRVYQKQ